MMSPGQLIWDTDGDVSLAGDQVAEGWTLWSSRCFWSSLVYTTLPVSWPDLASDIEFSEMWAWGALEVWGQGVLALCSQVLLTVFILPSPEGACAGWPGMEPTPSLTSNQESAGPAVEPGASGAPQSPGRRGVWAVPLGSLNGCSFTSTLFITQLKTPGLLAQGILELVSGQRPGETSHDRKGSAKLWPGGAILALQGAESARGWRAGLTAMWQEVFCP